MCGGARYGKVHGWSCTEVVFTCFFWSATGVLHITHIAHNIAVVQMTQNANITTHSHPTK